MRPIARIFAAFCLCFSLAAQTTPALRGARLFKSGPIQITADGQFVWTVNPDNDSISRLQTSNETATEFTLPAGSKHAPKGLSLTENGSEIWVAAHDSDKIFIFGSNGSLLKTIDLPWGSGPYSVAISPDQETAIVTLHRAEAVAILDVPSRTLTHILGHIFWAPMGIAWTDNGAAAWINHIFAPGEHPLQTRMDFSGPEPRVSAAIRITPADPRSANGLAAPYNIPEGGYLNIRGHGAQIPAASGRNELWVPTQYHNFTTESYSADSTMQSAIRHIDLTKRTLLHDNADKVILSAKYVHRAVGGGVYEGPGWDAQVAGPVDVAFSVDGQMAYLLHELSADLVVLPTSTPAVKPAGAAPLPEIKVGDRPIGLAVSPTEPKAYVYNLLSRDFSVIDLAAKTELKRIPATPITGEPFDSTRLLGAKIFHSSDDPRISKNAKISCASCHINGEHDGRSWGLHNLPGNHGPRSVPSLLGLSLSMGPKDPARGWGQLHRSGDRDEIQDFEHTFQNIQMQGTGFLGANAKPELGEPNAGLSTELDALANYLLQLEPLQRSPHRAPGGALSEAATRGATFFTGSNRVQKRADAGCAACHVPETGFVDFKFHDIGQRRENNEEELNARTPAWHVNTLTLVGVWATPPYSGLAEFGEAHSAEGAMIGLLLDSAKRANALNHHGKPDGLTGRQLRDLAEFVLSIDGNMTAAEVRGARDTTPPRIIRAEPASLTRIDVWFNETVQEQSAENLAHWELTDSSGQELPITSATWDPQNGDRVTLAGLELQPHSAYILSVAGPILDDAASATGGTANSIDTAAPENNRTISIPDRLTITLGQSGYENLTIPVHDTAMVGPGLSTWSHDSVWIAPSGNNPPSTTGFIRFGWQNPFRQFTATTDPAQIIKASFSVRPEFGAGQRLDLRRVLKRWSDPPTGNDWNQAATGAPTWRDSAHPNTRWASPGAGRLGTMGTSVSDYNAANDLASRIDAAVELNALNHRAEFASPLITDAFRFWFANPAVDYGYALRLAPGATQDLKFERLENGLNDHGPVLKITYLLPGATPRLEASKSGPNVQVRWPADYSGWSLESASSPTGSWASHSSQAQLSGPDYVLDLQPASSPQFFRLTRP